jgi:Spy/CpxP family protein refolding chaperone
MKTYFRSVGVALLALVLCGAATLSYAQQSDQTGSSATWNGHRHGHMGYLAKQLDLTDAQKTQVRTMVQAQRATLRPLMQQMARNRLAMLNATASGAFDQARVTALANQQAQVMAQFAVQKAQLHSQIYTQVLTADQKAKADQLRQNQITRITEHLQKLSQPSTEAAAQ